MQLEVCEKLGSGEAAIMRDSCNIQCHRVSAPSEVFGSQEVSCRGNKKPQEVIMRTWQRKALFRGPCGAEIIGTEAAFALTGAPWVSQERPPQENPHTVERTS